MWSASMFVMTERMGSRLRKEASDSSASTTMYSPLPSAELAPAHQLGEHDGAGHHGHALGTRGDDLGVVALDGGRGDHGFGAFDVRGVMTDLDDDAQRGEATRGRAVRLVGARHRVAEVVQDLGDAAHAGSSDAHEMDVLDGVLHADAFFLWG